MDKDSNSRVAVIITDGKYAIVGKAPQRMKQQFNCYDLMKGHAKVGEILEDAARREVFEESGIELENLSQISNAMDYLNGTTITFFKSIVEKLPDINELKCKSFFINKYGKQVPEIAMYAKVPLNDLPKYLYKRLSNLIIENNILSKI